MFVAFDLSVVFFLIAIFKRQPDVTGHSSGSSAVRCLRLPAARSRSSFLALFVRFARRRCWFFDSLSDNEYARYLIHYIFVSSVQQFAILGVLLSAPAKGGLVFARAAAELWQQRSGPQHPGASRIVS